jgi:hypothetical protein
MYSCHYDQQSVFVAENSETQQFRFSNINYSKNKGIDQNINSMRISWNKIFTLKVIPILNGEYNINSQDLFLLFKLVFDIFYIGIRIWINLI